MIKKITLAIIFVATILVAGCNQATSISEPVQTHTARPTSTFISPTVTPTRTPFPTPKTQAYPFPTQTPDPTAVAIFNDWNSKHPLINPNYNPMYIPAHTKISPDRSWIAASLLDDYTIHVAEIDGNKVWELTCDVFDKRGCLGVGILRWSKDSQYLYYIPITFGERTFGHYETSSLARLNVHTGHSEKLLNDTYEEISFYEFEISPDSNLLAYADGVHPKKVFVVDLKSKKENIIDLAFEPDFITHVIWQDNAHLLLNMGYRQSRLIIQLNIKTGEQRTIISDDTNFYIIKDIVDEKIIFVNRLIPSWKGSFTGNEYIYIDIDSGEVTYIPTIIPEQ